jgi:hypothetical protein
MSAVAAHSGTDALDGGGGRPEACAAAAAAAAEDAASASAAPSGKTIPAAAADAAATEGWLALFTTSFCSQNTVQFDDSQCVPCDQSDTRE